MPQDGLVAMKIVRYFLNLNLVFMWPENIIATTSQMLV